MSNARFVNKGLYRGIEDYATINAYINYFENGGKITVCKPGRRSKANTSFPLIKGTVAYTGAKSAGLKKLGIKGKNK